MIIDRLEHAARYYTVHARIETAFNYLQTTDLANIVPGKYAIDGENLFAIVQEYDTMDSATEQMEAHRKHIDVQYMIAGTELVGHALLDGQTISKEYDATTDFLLYADAPSFFTRMDAGTFMIFYPTDLHMPCIKDGDTAKVKKVVVKVLI